SEPERADTAPGTDGVAWLRQDLHHDRASCAVRPLQACAIDRAEPGDVIGGGSRWTVRSLPPKRGIGNEGSAYEDCCPWRSPCLSIAATVSPRVLNTMLDESRGIQYTKSAGAVSTLETSHCMTAVHEPDVMAAK
ncbi:hypothetical protein, partial [Leclercia adecarboxylata]|uniref:hypothetical protein n=2 Tax=Leclercia adecarboxylata TaxID=83655 RepID=UPI00234D3081